MSTTHTSHTPVRLGANHGYSIDGDVARIHADVEILDHALLTGEWALQLWACESPHSGGPLSGVIVAEAAIRSRVNAAEPHQQLVAEADARVPGGLRDYAMVLVLASSQDGHDKQVHDFANYPARQRFITPHLEGSVGYEIDGDHVLLKADTIRSPRDLDNLSGSLSLELWAVQTPYSGGSVDGRLLGRLDLGRLPGQGLLTNIAERVAYSAPPAGLWEIVLMLREWTGAAGFTTRDYARFAVPYQVDQPETATLVETPPNRQQPEDVPAVVAKTARPVTSPVAPAITRTAATDSARTGVSVNHAGVEELAAVKGVSKAVAREIVKGRPYTSLADLVEVRGIGPKLLLRIRESLSL